MTPCLPPYRPFRGAEPPHFVDRADESELPATTFRSSALAAWSGSPSGPRFHQLVVAGSGMGKTALLRSLVGLADASGWAAVLHRCRRKERALGSAALAVLDQARCKWAPEAGALASEVLVPHLASGCAAWPAPGSQGPASEVSWAALRSALRLVGSFARRRGSGLVLAFDDADLLAPSELESLGHLARSMSADGLPVALLLSGGCHMADRFARAGYFSGTFWLAELAPLDASEAREALAVPARDRGLDFDEGALELLCQCAGGSPLELQRLGFAAWVAAKGAGPIGLREAQRAARPAAEDLAARAS
jgi:hypothetical protein